MPEMKVCTGPCGRNLPRNETFFYRTPDGRFYAECRVCQRGRGIAWHQKLTDAQREEKKAQRHRWRDANRDKVIAAYGGACACCHEARPIFLGLVPAATPSKPAVIVSGFSFYSRIVKAGYPNTYRLLCHNCNAAITYTGTCPHSVTTS